MIKATAIAAVATLLVTGCATTNDAGVRLYKKPDLSKVTPGTPVKKVAGLKKPIKREVFTKGELKGAEAWLYEWDAPNDEVNNRMFTSVVVKDGVILGYAEDTPDKWSKNPQLHKSAKMASAFEDFAGHMAKAAQYQAAANFAAGYGASMMNRAATAPSQATQNFITYRPWENTQPVNYGMVGGGPIAYGGGQGGVNSVASQSSPANLSAWKMGNTLQLSDGSSVRRVGNTAWSSDGTSTTKVGNVFRHSDGTTTTQYGNSFHHSDGTTTTKYFNSYQKSDGSSVTVYGD